MYKKLRSKSIAITWFASYIVILLFSLIINLYVYVKVDNTLMTHIIKTNLEVLQNKKLYIDNIIHSTKVRAIEVATNQKVKTASRFTPPLSDVERYNILTLFENFPMYKSPENNFTSTYVYFNKIDYIKTNTSGAESQLFYNGVYGNDSTQYKNWLELLNKHYKGEFVGFNFENQSTNKMNLIYLKSVMQVGEYVPDATIAIEIDYKRILEKNDNGNEILILDKNNTIFASEYKQNIQDAIKNIDMNNTDSVINAKINGNDFVVLQVKSDESDWKYLYLINKSSFMRDINKLRSFLVFSIFLFMLFGIVVAWVLVKRNHKPIEYIMEKIKGNVNQGKNTNSNINELQYIGKIFTETLEENNRYNLRSEIQDKVIRDAIFSKLLKNESTGNVPKEDLLNSVNVTFQHENFVVLIFYIEKTDDMFFDNNNQDTLENYNLAKLIISNILQDMFLGSYTLYSTEVDGLLLTIINKDELNDTGEISKTLEDAQKFILDNFNIEFITGVSNIHSSIYGLSYCYKEVMKCLEYKFVLSQSIIKYENIIEPTNTVYYYPLEKEDQIINCLKASEYEKGRAILDEIFKVNFANPNVSIQLIRCLMYDIAGTMAKLLNDTGDLENDNFLEELDMFGRIGKATTALLMKDEMSNIFKEFCERNANENGGKFFIIDGIKEHINKLYKDPNLSVSTIATQFNINASYLSSVFKKQSEIGLLEYITKIRLEKAKEILKQGNYTVDEVSTMVGYGNTRTFSRLFIKYTGISPGKFRTITKD